MFREVDQDGTNKMKLEYGLVVALITSVIVLGLTHVDTAIASPFDILNEKMNVNKKLITCDCDDDTQSGAIRVD